MLHITSFDQFKALAHDNARIVVSHEIYGDLLTPIGVFQTITKDHPEAILLDSSEHSTAADACIYIGLDPLATFTAKGQKITITTPDNTKEQQGDVINALRQFYHQYKCASTHPLAKFAGGMIGYMAYDVVRLFENIPDRHPDEDGLPDISFTFYGMNVVFDKRSGKVLVTTVVEVQKDLEKQYHTAMKAMHQLIQHMMSHEHTRAAAAVMTNTESTVDVDISDKEYAAIVEKAKTYIRNGDAFQIVPSRRFRQAYHGDDFNIYRALRVLNPSPYQFYIRHKDYTLVGSSPERLVSLQQGIVETMPIAGTRKRGATLQEDLQLEQELINDDKEIAEHMMLVDLARNDIGSICEPGSVKVVDFKSVQKYSRVMHIVSRVQGKLRSDYDLFDVMRATFPAGTLTGAPKIRAMEIIDSLETSRRGFYGGGVIAIDNQGQLDGCITIRTALVKDGMATVRAGAGIVLDSNPEKEAQETRDKAQAVLDAIDLASGGFV